MFKDYYKNIDSQMYLLTYSWEEWLYFVFCWTSCQNYLQPLSDYFWDIIRYLERLQRTTIELCMGDWK